MTFVEMLVDRFGGDEPEVFARHGDVAFHIPCGTPVDALVLIDDDVWHGFCWLVSFGGHVYVVQVQSPMTGRRCMWFGPVVGLTEMVELVDSDSLGVFVFTTSEKSRVVRVVSNRFFEVETAVKKVVETRLS